LFDEVTNRRQDLLEVLTPVRLVFLLYLADGLGSVYRHDPYGWLILSLLVLAALSLLVRRRFPKESDDRLIFFYVSANVAMIAYGVLAVLHRVNSGWAYAVTGIVGLIYVSVRHSKSMGQAKKLKS
jgi:bacteriorhodopsin